MVAGTEAVIKHRKCDLGSWNFWIEGQISNILLSSEGGSWAQGQASRQDRAAVGHPGGAVPAHQNLPGKDVRYVYTF